MSRDVCDYDSMSSCHHECDPCGPMDSRGNHMSETEDAMALNHIGELPEVRRYLDDGKVNFMLHGGFGIRYIRESIADAALAAADQYASSLAEKYDVMLTLHNDEMHAAERLRAELAALRANRTEILDSAWNTANERAIKAEAELAAMKLWKCGLCSLDADCNRTTDEVVDCDCWAERGTP